MEGGHNRGQNIAADARFDVENLKCSEMAVVYYIAQLANTMLFQYCNGMVCLSKVAQSVAALYCGGIIGGSILVQYHCGGIIGGASILVQYYCGGTESQPSQSSPT